MQQYLGPIRDEQGYRALFAEHLKRRHENALGRSLDTHRRTWRPSVTLEGANYLQHALGRGMGAILWGMSFCGPVVPKMGLFQAGFPVTQLSTAHHPGFARTLAATRVLNKWALKSENKYLSDRVLVPVEVSSRVSLMNTLAERLRNNACASITGDPRTSGGVEVEFFGTTRRFATGAPRLAQSTGAALLTLYSYRTSSFQYRVVVEPPIALEPASDRAGQRIAVERFASRLEHHVKAHPADWDNWSHSAPSW